MKEVVTWAKSSVFTAMFVFDGVSGMPRGVGERTLSSHCEFAGSTWAVGLYPGGVTAAGINRGGFIIPSVVKVSGQPARAEVTFKFMKQIPNRTPSAFSNHTENFTNGVECFGAALVSSKEIKQDMSTYVMDDKLQIMVTLKVFDDVERSIRDIEERSSLATAGKEHSACIMSGIADLLASSQLTDFDIITSNEERIATHRVILCLLSPVFAAMLSGPMSEATSNQMTIADAEPAVVRHFAAFFYFGTIPDDLTLPHLFQLYGLAHKYQVESLQTACTAAIESHCTNDNVMQVLQLAELYRNAELKYVALKRLAKRPYAVAAVPGFFRTLGECWMTSDTTGGTNTVGTAAMQGKQATEEGAAGARPRRVVIPRRIREVISALVGVLPDRQGEGNYLHCQTGEHSPSSCSEAEAGDEEGGAEGATEGEGGSFMILPSAVARVDGIV